MPVLFGIKFSLLAERDVLIPGESPNFTVSKIGI